MKIKVIKITFDCSISCGLIKVPHLFRVIYKEIGVLIMMIEHTIFVRSDTILSDQNAYLFKLRYYGSSPKFKLSE